jgi:hypothetical protein
MYQFPLVRDAHFQSYKVDSFIYYLYLSPDKILHNYFWFQIRLEQKFSHKKSSKSRIEINQH